MDRPAYPTRWIDVASVAAFACLWIPLAVRLAGALSPGEAMWLLPVAAIAGIVFADLISGVVHWWADSCLDERAAFVGPFFIQPFREHHRDPDAILCRGFVALVGNNCLVCLPLLVGLALAPPPAGTPSSLVQASALATALGVLATNQLHQWAHAERVPRTVAWLQRQRLILSREEHRRHHHSGDRAYCVTTGWLNHPLDALGALWRAARAVGSRRPAPHGLATRESVRRVPGSAPRLRPSRIGTPGRRGS